MADLTPPRVLRDARGGLAFAQWPEHIPGRPAAAAWTSTSARQRVPDPPPRTLAWLVAAGALAAQEPAAPFTRLTDDARVGTAGDDGVTVVAFLGGDGPPPPAPQPPAAVSSCSRVILHQAAGWTIAGGGREIPFAPERSYFLFDVPSDAERGAHAHKALHQLVVALRGRFELELTDGRERRTFVLGDGQIGLYVPPGLWRDLRAFSPDAVCMVLASDRFDPADYIRNFDDFLTYRGHS